MIIDEDLQKRAHQMMMSPTMGKLCAFAKSLSIDVDNKEELKTALSTTSVRLIESLDNGRITFGDDEDHAMLMGLLVVCMEIVFDGRFAAGATQSKGYQ